MKARHLLKDRSPPYYDTTPDKSLNEAVGVMAGHNIGALVVMENGRLTSIVTERDVVRAIDRHGADISKIRVRDVMAPELVVCQAEDSLDEVMESLFRNRTGHRIRHLPVLEDSALIGVISISDIVNALLTETRLENRLLKSYIKNWPEPAD